MLIEQNMDCLLLHGWGVKNTVWKSLAGQLNGYGSVLTPCLYEVAGETSDNSFVSIAHVLNDKLNKDCVVIAWSMGGLIATCLSELSKKIKAIILISSTPCFANKDQWTNTIAEKDLEDLHSKLLTNPKGALDTFSGLIAHGDKQAKTTIKHLHQCMADESHAQILSSWLYQLKEIDLRNKFASLTAPASILLGEHDALINNKIVAQLKWLNANIECIVIKDCGHAPFISKAKDTQKLIEGFLSAKFSK